MSLRGSFMPLGAQLCPLGHFYAPWELSARPPSRVHNRPLCVCALASFKRLEAHICPLGAHLCPLGLNYVPWGSFMPPGGKVVIHDGRGRKPVV
jgi:hypothetical protein